MDVNEPIYMNVELDRARYDLALEAFHSMLAHYHDPAVIDATALMLGQDEIISFLEKVKSYDRGQAVVSMPMTYQDWSVFFGLLAYIDGTVLPERARDLGVLEDLWREVSALEDEAYRETSGPT